jgi:regulator of sigma E protease
MTSAITTVLSFILTIAILVVIHEYGHYLVARLCGVKVLRFSVGFGRPLWLRRFGRDGTEWSIASVPLGGYVKMLDEREGDVAPHERHRAFNNQPVGKRIAIVLAGPAANFLLAFLVYWFLFVVGQPGTKPVVDAPALGTPAAAAGFERGDTVLAVDGMRAQTWSDVYWQLFKQAVKRDTIEVEVRTAAGREATRRIDARGLSSDDLDKDLMPRLGLKALGLKLDPVIGRVVEGGVAQRSGLLAGDRVIAIDGTEVRSWGELVTRVRASPGKSLSFAIERGGTRLVRSITPESASDGMAGIGRIGIGLSAEQEARIAESSTIVRYGALESVGRAAARVWEVSVFSLQMLGRMVTGDVSWKNLSGPLTIADYAGQTARLGLIWYLGFLAVISVSLGVLNLLPVPLLDGGHLLYYVVEIVKGSPVSERVMEFGQRIGLALLLALTLFAFYNDINRLLTG